MSRIRKINVSQVEGDGVNSVLPAGTIVAFDFNGEYRLRVHDGVTRGGVPFPNAPSIVHNNDINITVDSGDSSSYTWNFGQTGVLTFPSGNMTMGDLGGVEGIRGGVDSTIGILSLGTSGASVLQWVDDFEEATAVAAVAVNSLLGEGTGNVQIVTGDIIGQGNPEHSWTFGPDGNLTLPTGGDILDSEGNSVLGGGAGDANVWVQTFETQDGAPTDVVALAISVEYDSAGNTIALFNHFNDGGGGSYYSVGKYTTTGAKIWTARFDDEFYTDGWGLAVDNDSDSIYVAGETDVEGQDNATLTKIDSTDGSIIWSKIYDFGFDSQSSVVDVASDGNPVMVGYASNGTDDYVATTKVDAADGSVIWSRSLDGQGDEQAYGMAVGPTGEVVAIGYMSQLGDSTDTENHMVVVKYDSAGAIQWQKAILFDEGFDCSGADADIDSAGNIYVTGSYQYSFDGGTTSALSILKLDGTGAKQWSRRVTGDCDTFGVSVVVGADDKLYLSGMTGDNNDENNAYTWVAAKYGIDGTVEWQRLIDNTTGWSFTGGSFLADGGGSNIAVKQDYVLLGGGFGDLINGDDPQATLIQVSASGDVFSVSDWDFKAASFSGVLNGTASDITVVNAEKTDTDNAENITTGTVTLTTEVSGFLIGTLYTVGGNDSLVNGAYSVSLGNTGTLTLPSGGTISEGVVTSNPTIQLTPASPEVASQKLVIKGGGGYSNTENGIYLSTNNITWAVSDTVEFYVYDPTRANETLYWWIVPEEGGISTTMSGIVELDGIGDGNFTFTLDSDAYEFRVRVSPEEDNYDPENIGVESVLMNGDAPAYGDYHLHLTTGDLEETSIFLGTDDHNVRTTTDGKIQITTPDTVNNVWEFDTNGELTLPTGGHIGPSGGKGAGTTYGGANDHLVSLTSYYNSGLYSSCVTAYADGTLNITAYNDGGPNPAKIWTFDNTGTLTLPDDSGIKSSTNIDITIDTPDSSTFNWRFGADGDLTLPRGYIKNDTTDGFVRIEGPLFADMVSAGGGGYATIANGVQILTHAVGDDTERKFNFSWDGSLYMPIASNNNQVGAIEWRNVGTATAQIKTVQGNATSPDGLYLLTYGTNTGTTIGAGFNKKWIFRDDGSLTIPGDIRSEGDINIDVNLSDSTLRRWTFGEDGDLRFPDGTTQTTAYTASNSAFTGYLDYASSTDAEATFTAVRSSKPLNAIKEIQMNPDILDISLDPMSVRSQLEKIVNTPRESKLTLTLASDTTKVWNYAVTHIGRSSYDNYYRDYTARFIRTYSDNASGIIRMVITKGVLSQKYWDPIAANDDWYVGTENSSSILAFTIADSTAWIRRDYEQLVKFFESVVDNVIYNGATEITDAEQLRTRFYANANTLISDMGGNLYYNFRAYNNDRSFFSVPLTSQTSTVNAEITFDASRNGGQYIEDGIPTSGAGFQVGQQITLLGSSLGAYSTDPADQLDGVHNATVTVTAVDESGGITAYTVSGYGVGEWGSDNISDGEDDQFDNSNKFSTNVSWTNDHSDGSSISNTNFLQYNSGFVTTGDMADGFFGSGSKYVISFYKGIVMLAATGVSNSVQWFAITGNSGFDDDGTVDEGDIKIGSRYSLYVRCVGGPEYLPQVDQRYLMSLETTDRYGLIEVINNSYNANSPSDNILLQSLHEGDFTVKGNDELILTANMEVTIRGGNGRIAPSGSSSLHNGRDVRIYGGDGFQNGGDTTKFGEGGDVEIQGGSGGGGYAYTISAMTNASPAVVTVNRPLELTGGVLARFGDMSGLSLSSSVVYYVDQISETQLAIYTDSDLTVPLDTRGLGSFVSGNIILGKRDGAVDISSLGYFNGNLKLNQFVWPTNYTEAAIGQYLRVKLIEGSTPYLEFASDVTAAIARNIESEGDVSIRVNLTDSTQRIWQFGEDGSLTLPIGVSIDNNVDPLYPRIIADSGKLFSVQAQGTSGSAALSWTVNPDAAGQYAAVAVSKGGGDNLAKVVLQAQSDSGDAGTAKIWKFDETGALTLPAGDGSSVIQSVQQNNYQSKVTVSPNQILLQARTSQSQSYSAANGDFTTATSDGNGMITFEGLQGGVAEFLIDTIENGGVYERTVRLNGAGPEYQYNSFNDTYNELFLVTAAPAGAVTEIRFSYTRISKIDIAPDAEQPVFRIESEPGLDIDIQSGDELRLTATDRVDIDTGSNMRLRAGDGSVQIITNFQVPGATTYEWTFGTGGDLTLPNGAVLRNLANSAIAFGQSAGANNSQGATAIAIGTDAGYYTQGAGAVAIGESAGEGYQGANAIAIGKKAGYNNQAANSIVLNATGDPLEQTTANTFTVAPIRNISATSGVLQYNSSTKEVSYSNRVTAETFNTDQITVVGNRITTTVTNANLEIECNGTGGVVINTVADATTASTTKSVGYLGLPQSATATSATLAIGDAGKHVYITSASQTITIPAAASVDYPIGTTLTFIAGPDATTVSIAITSDTLRLAGGTSTGTRTLAANGMATAVKVAATTWYINGVGLT